MKMIGIVWNSLSFEFDIARKILTEEGGDINNSYVLDFTENKFKEFLLELYRDNPDYPMAGPLKVKQLVGKFQRNSVLVVEYELPNVKKQCWDNRKEKYVYEDVSKYKKVVRSRLREITETKYGKYEFETTFHSSDDEKEYQEMKEIIFKYVER